MTDPGRLGLLLVYFLPYLVPILLLVIGYAVGATIERRHFRSLAEREARLGAWATPSTLKTSPDLPIADSFLVAGSVVIASDYFKTWAALLMKLFGGRLSTLEPLLERGRREAILRMREQAAAHGAAMVMNVRLETSTISVRGAAAGICVEVIAYGSALVLAPPQ